MSAKKYPPGVLQRLQERERELLRVFDALCREHGLIYFIDGGTCLGAVRHGGFIPWDDDVDVAMPIKDYVKFLKLAPSALPAGYSLHTSMNTPGFTALWAKIFIDGTRFNDANAVAAGTEQGIFLDVFPFCPLDSDEARARAQLRGCNFWQKLSYLKGFSNPKLPKGTRLRPLVQLALNLAHQVAKHVPQKLIVRKFGASAKPRTPSLQWFSACYSTWGTYSDVILFPTRLIDFDGIQLQAPADPDAYLRTLYGDYMQLPPEDERYTHLPKVLDFGDGENAMIE